MYIHVYTVKIKKIKKKKHRKPLKKLFFVKIVIKIDSQTTKHTIQWIIFYCRIFNTYETKYRFLQTL